MRSGNELPQASPRFLHSSLFSDNIAQLSGDSDNLSRIWNMVGQTFKKMCKIKITLQMYNDTFTRSSPTKPESVCINVGSYAKKLRPDLKNY